MKMRSSVQVLAGVAAGVAFAVSCDSLSTTSAEDMAMSPSGNCSGTCTVSGTVDVSGKVAVSSIEQPVTIAQPVEVKGAISVDNEVSVASINAPVVVQSVTNPVTVASVTNAIAVSGIATPVTIAGPIDVNVQAQALTVTQPMKTLSADTDANQLVGGQVNGADQLIATGPVVISDIVPWNSSTIALRIGVGSTCPLAGAAKFDMTFVSGPSVNGSVSGARIFVAAGSVACGSTNNGPTMWSGWRPY